MGKFKGKTILFLGTSVGTIDMIQYVKKEGAYTIVTDYLEKEKSEGKNYSDEYAMISTLEVDALEEFCRKKDVNVVFAGVSEVNLLSAQIVSQRLNLPFYFTNDQWERFMNKGNFRNLCLKYYIPVPETFFVGKFYDLKEEMIQDKYPVIVKPVDGCANMGISICTGEGELSKACKIAGNNSKDSQIIIEKFLGGGIEVSCTYVLQGNLCRLVCMGDKYAYENKKGLKALSHAYIYPSNHLAEFLSSGINEKISAMFLQEGIRDCTVFLQGIYQDGKFYFFEAGLRMEGTASYRITEHMNGQNFMNYMVDRMFDVNTNYDVTKEDPNFGGKKCIYFSQIVKEGKIFKISGTDCMNKIRNLVSYEQRHQVGDYVEEDGTLRQLMFRYVLVDDDMEKMIDSIQILQRSIDVYDEAGCSMLVKGFDSSVLMNERPKLSE